MGGLQSHTPEQTRGELNGMIQENKKNNPQQSNTDIATSKVKV